MLKKSFHKKTEIVFIYLGDLLFDARITNMAQSLIKNNYKVSFIGVCNKPPSFSVYQNIKIYNLSISDHGALKYVSFFWKVKKLLRKLNFDYYVSSDLYSLAPIVCSVFKTKKIIYDCREIYFKLAAHTKKPFRRWFNFQYENFLLRYVNTIMVTAKSDYAFLKKHYGQHKNLNWSIIYNYPGRFNKSSQTIIKKNKINIIYQGVIQKGRGVKPLIDVAINCKTINVIIVGCGEYKPYLQSYYKNNNTFNNENVFFINRIPYVELFSITRQCDVGWCVINNIGLSNEYALPNKLFEYLACNIPVICSNFTNMKNVVNKYSVGEVVKSSSVEDNIRLIKKVFKNKHIYEENMKKVHHKFSWCSQEKNFLKLFNFSK